MKAVFIRRYGGPEVLEYGDFADPAIGAGEVLVKVAAAAINPIDIMERSGLTKDFKPVSFPGVLGWDLSGTVVRVGPGVHGFAVGDRVLAWAYHTYAELCAVNAELLAKVPDGLDLVEAAALPLATTTGNQLISIAAEIKAGQTVLVSGAFGGVGRAAVFTAKDRGARVIAGVLKKQAAAAQSLGADEIVALDDDAALKALPPVDAVANTVRGKTADELPGKVRPGGVFASVTGAPASVKDYPAVKVVSYVSHQDAKTVLAMAQAVGGKKLVIPIERKLPLSDAREGHIAVGSGGAGKVLLLP
ncbi:MAG: NADP-dependent oxidoreductase [Hyphomicrobiales bacterium]|nr:NADP-dependent oxidoreductase [Hyphomicrobiales bacterium]MBV8440812.1 NADP-dependent oxidoreductase [Hyphomicrobiales bacterium]